MPSKTSFVAKVCCERYYRLTVLTRKFATEDYLKTLFIVSDVHIVDEGSLGTTEGTPEWVYSESLELPGETTLELSLARLG